METALPQKFLFILDTNLAKANCTENQVCTSCDIVVLTQCLKTRKRADQHNIINTSPPRMH